MDDAAGAVSGIDGEDPPSEPAGTPDESQDKVRGLIEANKAERAKRQALEAELAKFQQAEREREEAEAAKRGEFQTIAEKYKAEAEAHAAELASLREQVEAANAARQTRIVEALGKLPEGLRQLMPDGLTLDAQEAHLEKLRAMAEATSSGPAVSGRVAGTGGDPMTLTAEEKAWAESQPHIAPHLGKLPVQKVKLWFKNRNPS